MMRISLHVYRTHDHDLMLLHQAGAVSIGLAAKKAVIAYYKGEPLTISTKTRQRVDVGTMPLSLTFNFTITESDAAGIIGWISGIRLGFRNCLFKCILRHYLDDPATALFRDDPWAPKAPENRAVAEPVSIPAAPKNGRRALKGSEWVEAVSKEKAKKGHSKKISDLDSLPSEPAAHRSDGPANSPGSIEPEQPFDAFEAFQQLRNGG